MFIYNIYFRMSCGFDGTRAGSPCTSPDEPIHANCKFGTSRKLCGKVYRYI